MSYNGSGVFQINSAGQPVITGTTITSTAFNALTTDLATGLTTAITKDGQTATTARIPFALGVSSTLTTDATSSTTGSIITAGGISSQKALFIGTTATITNGIVGTATNNNASAGIIGEYTTAAPAGVGMTTAVAANVASISLTAGDWDVFSNYSYSGTSTVLVTLASMSITTSSATNNGVGPGYYQIDQDAGEKWFGNTGTRNIIVGPARMSLASTTTVYAVGQIYFGGVGTVTASAYIAARRVR